jgi:hypothetical protein
VRPSFEDFRALDATKACAHHLLEMTYINFETLA